MPAPLYFPPNEPEAPWERIAPADAGWDAAALAGLVEWCEASNTHQLLIVDRGRIVAEHYAHGADAATQFDVASVQKSVVSFVVGVLVARGVLGVETPASKWLGDGWTQAAPEQEREILLRHLITMTTGLYDDFAFEVAPGTHWYYNNNGYHQVRKAIERATGRSCQDVFAELLFARTGMAHSQWRERPKMLDPSGWALSGLHSTARDMARFGLAVLAGGVWDGTDLGCDAHYFAAALRASQQLNPSYGYLWWLFGGERAQVPGVRSREDWNPRKSFGGIEIDRPLAPSAPRDAVGGMGAGDQRLYVVPSRGLVVVRHGAAAGEMAAAGGRFDEAFWQRLMAALPAEEA